MSSLSVRANSYSVLFSTLAILVSVAALGGCEQQTMDAPATSPGSTYKLSRSEYAEKLYGFWLGQSIANWTGLVTELDKIGGEGPHGRFYTRDDWGKPDEPNIFSNGVPTTTRTLSTFTNRFCLSRKPVFFRENKYATAG